MFNVSKEPSNLFIYFVVSFIIGIFFGSFFYSIYFLFIVLIISFSILGVFYKKTLIVFFCLLFFVLGYFYVDCKFNKIVNLDIYKQSNFVGKVISNPQYDFEKTTAIIKIENYKVLVSTKFKVNYGDTLSIEGEILKPKNKSYQGYLAKKGISGVMYNPKIEIEKKGFDIFLFKNNLEKVILKELSFEKAGILSAMILGEKDNLDSSLKERLSFAGVSHITAISGMHIVILSIIILETFLFLKINRRKSIFLTIGTLFLYILIVGFPVSAIRAFIMICFILLSQVLGRQTDSLRALLISGFIILLLNPLALRYDLGFQLSFLAVMSIIFYNNLIFKYLGFLKWKYAREIISITISAQILTIPLIVYTFSYFSLTSIVTNMLIVPFLPIVMCLGILSLIFNFFFLPLSFLLDYFLGVINFFSFAMNLEISLIVLIIIYLVLFYFGIRQRKFEFYI